ncbi:MAG: hypothetical protein AAF485_21790 [Chloroflexota bacterium]
MPILPETEQLHPVLGPIRFDDGKPLPNDKASKQTATQWVARPHGWYNDTIEFYLDGDEKNPTQASLQRAVKVFGLIETITEQAKALLPGVDIELSWVDCQSDIVEVVFFEDVYIYALRRGILDKNYELQELSVGTW